MAFPLQPESIFDLLRGHPAQSPAIVNAGNDRTLSYGDLRTRVEATAEALATGGRRVHFLFCFNTDDAIVTYLAAVLAGVPICLLDGSRPETAGKIVAAHRPPVLLIPSGTEPPDGYKKRLTLETGFDVLDGSEAEMEPHPSLALLLTTSGSTGDPKLVRLSTANAVSNARSIVRYLNLNAEERALQSLPIFYSYGLSVLHSHLAAGGTVVLSPHSFLRPEFWKDADRLRCTSFAGVPHMYETLKRLRFDPGAYPSLRTLTQAGGRLSEALIEWYSKAATAANRRFFVMYGQTEATARISYVPPEMLAEKVGSIGIPIPDGAMSLRSVEGAGDLQEVIYSGPNVMMGYADGPAALARGDEMGGVLPTGDLGRVDADGYFYITGRLKRFAKLFGKRVNLADVEATIEQQFSVRAAAVDDGQDHLVLCLEAEADLDVRDIGFAVAETLGVPPVAIRVRRLDKIPMTASGKKDYAAVAKC